MNHTLSRLEKKRSHAAAVYYGECCRRSIKPDVAEASKRQAEELRKKWWQSSFRAPTKKRRKQQLIDDDMNENEKVSSASSANIVSVSSMNSNFLPVRNGADSDGDNKELLSISEINTLRSKISIQSVKDSLLEELKSNGGETSSSEFIRCCEILEAYHRSKSWDGRGSSLPGNWLTLSKPTYSDCLGQTTKGEYLYTLGRMSFDMFKPTNLVCSIQATFNSISRPIDPMNPHRPLHVPKKLMKDIEKGDVNLRTYE